MTTEAIAPEAAAATLRAVRFYQHVLEDIFLDVSRARIAGQVAGYVVDFDILYDYLYAKPSEGCLFLEYVLKQGNVLLLVGPGTLIEMVYEIEALTGVRLRDLVDVAIADGARALQDDGAVAALLSGVYRAVSSRLGLEAADSGEVDYRLVLRSFLITDQMNMVLARADLFLSSQVVSFYTEVMTSPVTVSGVAEAPFDRNAFGRVNEALSQYPHRRERTRSNFADALNAGAVAGLRSAAASDPDLPFPYLLTATSPLLDISLPLRTDEIARQFGYKETLARSPTNAFYGAIAPRSNDSDLDGLRTRLKSASNWIADLNFRIATGFGTADEGVAGSAYSDSNEVLQTVAALFEDDIARVVLETRRDLEVAVRNRAILTESESNVEAIVGNFTSLVRRLAEHNQVLHLLYKSIWKEAVVYSVTEDDETTVHTWSPESAAAELRVEIDKGLTVGVTWPSESNLGDVLGFLNQVAWPRHQMGTSMIVAGSIDQGSPQIDVLSVPLPVTLEKLQRVLRTTTRWLRFESNDGQDFALYVGLLTSVGKAGELGIITSVDRIDVGHLSELISVSGGDFLSFASLQVIRDMLNQALGTATQDTAGTR